MRYQGRIYRPPSEANSYILQATVGCSWNQCTYCVMYSDKPNFWVKPLHETLDDIEMAGEVHGDHVTKVFVADGDGLVMHMDHWRPILDHIQQTFPRLRRVSCYAMASNILEKSSAELEELRAKGLSLLYIGPESGDEQTMRRIAKGPRPGGASRDDKYLFQSHVDAAAKAKAAGMKISTIFLLGAGGVERSKAHAEASAQLITEMDPEFLSALTLTVVPGSALDRTSKRSRWTLPDVPGLLSELRIMVDGARPTDSIFRTNHASNYLPLAGRLPRDRTRIVSILDAALSGEIPLREEWSRGL